MLIPPHQPPIQIVYDLSFQRRERLELIELPEHTEREEYDTNVYVNSLETDSSSVSARPGLPGPASFPPPLSL